MFLTSIKSFLRFETRRHLFVLSANFLMRQYSIYITKCNIILNLCNELVLFFENEFILFDVTPQAAFLGFLGFINVNSELLLIQNHLLLIFKIYIYNSRRSESLKIKSLIREIAKVKKFQEKTSLNIEKKTHYIQEKMATS